MPNSEPDAAASGGGSHLVLLLELLLFIIGLAGVLIMQVDKQQSLAYMDKVFHVPMAQRYCNGDYNSWDPKITTPPGVYAFAAGVLRTTAMVTRQQFDSEVWCDTFYLRLTNLLPLAMCLLALYGVISSLASPAGLTPRVQVLKAFSICLLPVLFFFSSLFYTDLLSLASVLIMYFLHLNQHTLLSALVGLLALTCRQTNIAWTCLCIGELVEARWLQRANDLQKKLDKVPFDKNSIINCLLYIALHPIAFIRTVLVTMVTTAWPHLITLLSFAAFVFINNGVALGDKQAHTAQLHLVQPLYCVAFVAAMQPRLFLQPIIISNCARALLTIRGCLVAIAIMLACCLAVAMGTVEHPYLLADNRHFTFYIWRRIIKQHWLIPYALVPVYTYCLYAFSQLAKHRTALFPPLLFACTSIVLVPAGLIEPRYYIVPFVLWRLHNTMFDNRISIAIDIAYYAIVNAIVYRLFLYRTFQWPDATVQRFMW